jgi:hypothetical protein
MKSQSVWAMAVMVAVLLAAGVAGAAPYTGSLSTDCMEIGGGSWLGYDFTMEWEVTNEDGDAPVTHPWKYTYTLDIDGNQGGISHLILEVSEGETDGTNKFESANLTDLDGNAEIDEIRTFAPSDPGASNPGLPGAIYGIKFEPVVDDSMSMTWSFYSDRAPVWGDFYAKDGNAGGGENYVYNSGLGSPDSDPLADPADGPLDCHILVPDTFSDTPGDPGDPGDPVAEPSALALMVLSGLGLTTRRRRS